MVVKLEQQEKCRGLIEEPFRQRPSTNFRRPSSMTHADPELPMPALGRAHLTLSILSKSACPVLRLHEARCNSF